MTTKLDIFGDKLLAYQQKPVRGIYVDTHNEFVKVSPAEYTGDAFCAKGIIIPKREIYDAIVAAEIEAKERKLNKNFLPLGPETHSIKLQANKIGLATSFKIDLILNLDRPQIELEAFKNLVQKYGVYSFPLGRVPFHNNVVSLAITQLSKNYKHARISSVFYRKRDQHPRVYVGVAMNDFVFGLRTSTVIDIDDYDDHIVAPFVKPRIEIDL